MELPRVPCKMSQPKCQFSARPARRVPCAHGPSRSFPGSQAFGVARVLRVMRIFRVFKLARYSRAASLVGTAIRASRHKIAVFMVAVVTIMFVVGSLMYLIEGPENGFTSIPKGVYWAIITLTTVGHGGLMIRRSAWWRCRPHPTPSTCARRQQNASSTSGSTTRLGGSKGPTWWATSSSGGVDLEPFKEGKEGSYRGCPHQRRNP